MNPASAAVAAVAPALFAAGTGLAFKKIDSLLRGQEAAELATLLDLLRPYRCIIAPAFPAPVLGDVVKVELDLELLEPEG